MFALQFHFVHGRYHASPWGRHVNEGAVAWPPEPWRLLRALIACWHRKADPSTEPEAQLHALVEALAAVLPVYRLPTAVHAHTRHYMPQACLDTKTGMETKGLVLDAFYRMAPDDPLVAAWPEAALSPELFALAGRLAAQLAYRGRAESAVTATALDDWAGEHPLCQPLAACADGVPPTGWQLAEIIAPLPAPAYRLARPDLLALGDGSKPAARRKVAACLPPALTDAMQIGTGQLQAAGWSQPPAARTVTYAVPPVGPRLVGRPRAHRARACAAPPTVARLILAGRPRPPMTEAVSIAEVFRAALLHAYARLHGDGTAPPLLSGRDAEGSPLRTPDHSHAFFLPEDSDGDGHIDHLVLYARSGLDAGTRRAVEGLRRLWLGQRGSGEWQVALEGVGEVAAFGHSRLLGASSSWTSTTPYLRPRHVKRRDDADALGQMVRWECAQRRWETPEVSLIGAHGREIRVGNVPTNTLRFRRFRAHRKLVQPDATGVALRLVFAAPRPGPVALGFASHFGLGLFAAQP